ncbi:queuosine precursor transporter [bacterium]|nr:queuosine precursor transporter [bacterium]
MKLNLNTEFKTDILLGFFIASLILANLLGSKITTILGMRVSVGIFFIPILFLVTDIITEVHGKARAKNFFYISISVLLFALIMMYLCIIMPAHEKWLNQEAYEIIFRGSLRMTIASLIAFILSQYHDIWAFQFWKKKTHGKFLWLRNNASTIVSQFIDTTIFMYIAFYHLTPKFTTAFIFSLIIPYWLFKIAFAIIDTPFCYLGVKWLKKDNLQ